MNVPNKHAVSLGLDLGPNSIGWSVISHDSPISSVCVHSGARVFEAGLEGLEKDGKGKSRNADRREKRSIRRLLERRKRRMVKLANILMRAGLLPECDYKNSDSRHQAFKLLDNTVSDPYILRVDALDRKLVEHELGRAIYHLAQRRGFLSNRKSTESEDERKGVVKESIDGLKKEIDESEARTLGEYFAKLVPKTQRYRSRYTSRKMYEEEFSAIWSAQQIYYPNLLTDELRKQISKAIFFQRPLKSQAGLIGKCELEPTKKRAPWSLIITQRFRYLQTVNNLQIIDTSTGEQRDLTEDEREILINAMETNSTLKFPAMRKLLKLKAVRFNYELGGEKSLRGNFTSAKLSKVLGEERWSSMSEENKNAVIEDARSIEKDESLKKRGINHWKLDEESAEKFGHVRLEQGYCNFSKKALVKLIPELEKGTSLNTAIKELYPERHEKKGVPLDILPSLKDCVKLNLLSELRNPIVERTLTELRKVVNAVIKEYGKPDFIHIELARDLRNTPKRRGEIHKRNKDNQKKREEAAKLVIKETGNDQPSRDDITKALLYEECGHICPYTGKSISPSSLFGSHPQFDIEHIIPYERSMDDSFLNKTLCDASENRNIKKKKTPAEAYAGTEKWDEIISRVKKFKGNAAKEKLRRFQMTTEEVSEFLDKFTARQLNDTRWASKWAKQYLGLLHGGVNDDGIDNNGTRRVQASPGQLTAYLRNSWELNGILTEGPFKSRDDHRHHAVDAIVIALTGPKEVKMLSSLAAKGAYTGRQRFKGFPAPCPGFVEKIRESINGIVTSHRLSRRVRGALHKESFYGKTRNDDTGKKYVHIRKPLEALKDNQANSIVDPVIRDIVLAALEQSGKPPKDTFKLAEDHPVDKAGRRIHRVTVKENWDTFPIGSGTSVRNVMPDRNHHMALYEILDEDGKTVKWVGKVVSMREAYNRRRANKPIVDRSHVPGRNFLFSIGLRDVLEIDADDGKRQLVTVSSIASSTQVRWMLINDARIESSVLKKGRTGYPDSLRKKNCQKMTVSPLGVVRRARD